MRRAFAFLALATLWLAVGCGDSADVSPSDSVSGAKGSKSGVPTARLAKLSTGANVTRWFWINDDKSDAHYRDYVSDAEISAMVKMGIKHVRLCIQPENIMDAKTGKVIERVAAFVDKAVERLNTAGLLVILDIHNNDKTVEGNPDWEQAFSLFWTAFAKRYAATDPDMVMFEILNEPVYEGKEAKWSALQEKIDLAIRSVAPRHTIVATGANWGGIDGLLKLKPLRDLNVVYSFQFYDPFVFSHQGATWADEASKFTHDVPYPSSPEAVASLLPELQKSNSAAYANVKAYGQEKWGHDRLAARFKLAIDWGQANGVPLYCGEFGVFPEKAKGEDRARWFKDFSEILGSNKVGWATWGWDDAFGLNRTLRDGKLVVDPVVAKSLGLKPLE